VGRSVRRLRAAVGRALAGGSRGLVLDLSGVDYLDAAGIGALVSCHRRAVRVSQRVVLTGLRRHVREVLGVTRLAGRLAEAADEEQAVRVLDQDEARRDLPPHIAAPSCV
jgi:anti-anti-sigma factor